MPYVLIKQRRADYAQWRTAFDRLADTRDSYGIETVLVTRNMHDPEEVVVLFAFSDMERLHAYLESSALQGAHRQAGVLEGTTVSFLESAGPAESR